MGDVVTVLSSASSMSAGGAHSPYDLFRGVRTSSRILHDTLARGWSRSSAASTREVFPTTDVRNQSLTPPWLWPVQERLVSLAGLDRDWDSYGAQPLDLRSVETLLAFLLDYSYAIQKQPSVSLTPSGGLIASWSSPRGEVDVEFDSVSGESVLWEEQSGFQWEGDVAAAGEIDKWLWLASADN